MTRALVIALILKFIVGLAVRFLVYVEKVTPISDRISRLQGCTIALPLDRIHRRLFDRVTGLMRLCVEL